MDVFRKLQSILVPQGLPANNAYRPAKADATKAASFSRAFVEATAEDAGIQPFRVRPPVAEGFDKTEGAPTVLPDVPESGPRSDQNQPPAVENARVSLEEAIRAYQGNPVVRGGGDGAAEPESPILVDARPAATVAVKQVAASVPASFTLPPLGVLWGAMTYRGSGASGPGIGGTDADAQATLGVKVGAYTDPTRSLASLNQEARLFLDAVSKGYVDNSPEGLGTLLSYLSKGSIGPEARPPMMTAYFNQFYAAERAAGR